MNAYREKLIDHLTRSGLRKDQIAEVLPRTLAFVGMGSAGEQALLAALYVWGPENRKRCRQIAAHGPSANVECGNIVPCIQVSAILTIHGRLVEMRIKDLGKAMHDAIVTDITAHQDEQIAKILEDAHEMISMTKGQRWIS